MWPRLGEWARLSVRRDELDEPELKLELELNFPNLHSIQWKCALALVIFYSWTKIYRKPLESSSWRKNESSTLEVFFLPPPPIPINCVLSFLHNWKVLGKVNSLKVPPTTGCMLRCHDCLNCRCCCCCCSGIGIGIGRSLISGAVNSEWSTKYKIPKKTKRQKGKQLENFFNAFGAKRSLIWSHHFEMQQRQPIGNYASSGNYWFGQALRSW